MRKYDLHVLAYIIYLSQALGSGISFNRNPVAFAQNKKKYDLNYLVEQRSGDDGEWGAEVHVHSGWAG